MYMFIEFGRLGCKHVIYLGDVYVRLVVLFGIGTLCVADGMHIMTFWLKARACLSLLISKF